MLEIILLFANSVESKMKSVRNRHTKHKATSHEYHLDITFTSNVLCNNDAKKSHKLWPWIEHLLCVESLPVAALNSNINRMRHVTA